MSRKEDYRHNTSIYILSFSQHKPYTIKTMPLGAGFDLCHVCAHS